MAGITSNGVAGRAAAPCASLRVESPATTHNDASMHANLIGAYCAASRWRHTIMIVRSSLEATMRHREQHRTGRIGWLRAAVLGANDGIVSTASLIVGVASAASSRQQIIVAGMAGVVAGALSMAAGEYVSVSSQADTERADL